MLSLVSSFKWQKWFLQTIETEKKLILTQFYNISQYYKYIVCRVSDPREKR